MTTTSRAQAADDLHARTLDHLAARPGRWVPRAELLALTPPVTGLVTEADLGDTAFGFDDPRGAAWTETRPDEDLVIEVTGALRRALRLAERISPDGARTEYLSWEDSELVGLAEIGTRLRVERDTVDHWRVRRVLPEPDPADAKGRRPRWKWGVIRAWALETRRGPRA